MPRPPRKPNPTASLRLSLKGSATEKETNRLDANRCCAMIELGRTAAEIPGTESAMTQREMLSEIQRAFGLLETARARAPKDLVLSNLDMMLREIEKAVESHWPLSGRDRERVVVGRYAVRNLDPDLPDLVDALVGIDLLA